MTAIYIGVEIIAVGIFWIAYRYRDDDGDRAGANTRPSTRTASDHSVE